METREVVYGQCWGCEENTECRLVTVVDDGGTEEEVLLCPGCEETMRDTAAEADA